MNTYAPQSQQTPQKQVEMAKSMTTSSRSMQKTIDLVDEIAKLHGVAQADMRLNEKLGKIKSVAAFRKAYLEALKNQSGIDQIVNKIRTRLQQCQSQQDSKLTKLDFLGKICGLLDIQLKKEELEQIIGEKILERDNLEFPQLNERVLKTEVAFLKAALAEKNIAYFYELLGRTTWNARFQIAQAYGEYLSTDLLAAFNNYYFNSFFLDKYEVLAKIIEMNAESPLSVALLLLLNDEDERKAIIEIYEMKYGKVLANYLLDSAAIKECSLGAHIVKFCASVNGQEQSVLQYSDFLDGIAAEQLDLQKLAKILLCMPHLDYQQCCAQFEKLQGTSMEKCLEDLLSGQNLIWARCCHFWHCGVRELVTFYLSERRAFPGCDFAVAAFFSAGLEDLKDEIASCETTTSKSAVAVRCGVQRQDHVPDAAEAEPFSLKEEGSAEQASEQVDELEKEQAAEQRYEEPPQQEQSQEHQACEYEQAKEEQVQEDQYAEKEGYAEEGSGQEEVHVSQSDSEQDNPQEGAAEATQA